MGRLRVIGASLTCSHRCRNRIFGPSRLHSSERSETCHWVHHPSNNQILRLTWRKLQRTHSSESEIGDLDTVVRGDEQVFAFEVSMQTLDAKSVGQLGNEVSERSAHQPSSHANTP